MADLDNDNGGSHDQGYLGYVASAQRQDEQGGKRGVDANQRKLDRKRELHRKLYAVGYLIGGHRILLCTMDAM